MRKSNPFRRKGDSSHTDYLGHPRVTDACQSDSALLTLGLNLALATQRKVANQCPSVLCIIICHVEAEFSSFPITAVWIWIPTLCLHVYVSQNLIKMCGRKKLKVFLGSGRDQYTRPKHFHQRCGRYCTVQKCTWRSLNIPFSEVGFLLFCQKLKQDKIICIIKHYCQDCLNRFWT
jgi:hypothetical protein